MDTSKAQAIISKVLDGSATEEEEAIVESWYLELGERSEPSYGQQDYVAIRQRILDKIYNEVKPEKKPIKLWKPFSIAAAILFLTLTGYFLFNTRLKTGKDIDNQYATEIHPGTKTATLTLANGKQILLSDALNGEIAHESGVRISKGAQGQLVYTMTSRNKTSDTQNTLSTARGETFQLVLPDGSTVWLNAASSLTYTPALITKDGKRSVKLTGEGYFEVAKDKKHPFKVESRGNEIEVLGTHFNINAYEDEPAMKTTLLEGSVKINSSTFLKPDQQAIISNQEIKVVPVVADAYIDWTGDAFNFRKEELQSIMRKVSRWYDVSIEYKDIADLDETFTGYISRDADVSKVLKTLSKISNLKFRLEKKKIVVSR